MSTLEAIMVCIMPGLLRYLVTNIPLSTSQKRRWRTASIEDEALATRVSR